MICLNCGKEFILKKDLFNLFETKKYVICNNCLKSNLFDINFDVIPLNKYSLHVISLYKTGKRINPNSLFYEIGALYSSLCKKWLSSVVIPYEHFILNEEIIAEFSGISSLLKSDIIILSIFY